jgi:hypothetical protein
MDSFDKIRKKNKKNQLEREALRLGSMIQGTRRAAF